MTRSALSCVFLPNFAADMTKRRALLIINPISGTASKDGLGDMVASTLAPAGYEVTAAFTRGPDDATRLARNACADGFDAVIAAGGDGTVNETAAALRSTGVTLGILPCGSGNGLARHLNIPVDIHEALRIILDGHRIYADCASANGQPFFCTFGVGFDAAVSETFARQRRRGRLMYVRSAISTYLNYAPETYTIIANGQVITEQAFLVAVCNASQYGNNAYIAPDASITDGLLDVIIVNSGPLPALALMGIDMMVGSLNHNTLIHTVRTPSVEIRRHSRGPVHLDGEPMTFDRDINIRCHRGALSVFTPGELTVYPFITPVTAIIRDARLTLRNILPRR